MRVGPRRERARGRFRRCGRAESAGRARDEGAGKSLRARTGRRGAFGRVRDDIERIAFEVSRTRRKTRVARVLRRRNGTSRLTTRLTLVVGETRIGSAPTRRVGRLGARKTHLRRLGRAPARAEGVAGEPGAGDEAGCGDGGHRGEGVGDGVDTCPHETLFIGRLKQQTRNPLLANGRKLGCWIGAIEGSLTQEKKGIVLMPNPESESRKSWSTFRRGARKSSRERARESAISRRAETAAHARERDVDRPRV